MINESKKSNGSTAQAIAQRADGKFVGGCERICFTNDQIEELITNLTNPEQFMRAAELLINQFAKFPYVYNIAYIKVLFMFFEEEHFQNETVIHMICSILISLFEYDKQNTYVFEIMKNNEFYGLLWSYIDRIPSAMILYKWLIKTYEGAFLFALQNNIIEKLAIIMYPESTNTINIFEFISSFARYSKFYDHFNGLINDVCNLTFNTINIDTFASGLFCLSLFMKRSHVISAQILHYQKFYEFCQLISPERPDTLNLILEFINQALQNQHMITLADQQTICNIGSLLISEMDTNLKMYIFELTKKSFLVQGNGPLLLNALKVLSALINGPEIAKACIQNQIHLFLFQLANLEKPFVVSIEVFKAVSNIVSSADFADTKTMIDLGYISLIEEQIEVMNKIPNFVINALKNIKNFSENISDAAYWANLIFDNEVIMNQIQNIIDHPSDVDDDINTIDVSINARSLLNRKYE